MNILITDQVDAHSVDIYRNEGFTVSYRPGMPPDELLAAIAGVHALIVRSQTRVTAQVIERGKELKIIGRAGAGVDNIDIDAATRRGIIVMNTPGGNTVSTAEHTIAMLLALARNIPQANASVREGKWERKSFVGTELFGKTVGVVGLGKVGSEVAKRLVGFGVSPLAYDPVLTQESAAAMGVELSDLAGVLQRADFITIHSPLVQETRHLLNARSLALCKKGVRIVNCARGGIIDEGALLEALDSGQVGGAALDVFEKEPPGQTPLTQHPKVVVTPHLGASTEEAQEKVALQIAHQVCDALKERGIAGSVNADVIQYSLRRELKPYLGLLEKMGRLVCQLHEGELRSIALSVSGKGLHDYQSVLAAAFLKGLFQDLLSEPVNYVNAAAIAKDRGLTCYTLLEEGHQRYSPLLTIRYETRSGKHEVSGTIFGERDPRIVSIDGFHFEFSPEGNFLFFSNLDRPGMLASVSAVLAGSQVNIAGLSLGRYGPGKQALTVVWVDTPLSPAILQEIASIDGVFGVKSVIL
jgi:D-3-phosphoglycerate dehydrogenase